MSLSCVTGGKLCTGCMACQEDSYYGEIEEDLYFEEDNVDE